MLYPNRRNLFCFVFSRHELSLNKYLMVVIVTIKLRENIILLPSDCFAITMLESIEFTDEQSSPS